MKINATMFELSLIRHLWKKRLHVDVVYSNDRNNVIIPAGRCITKTMIHNLAEEIMHSGAFVPVGNCGIKITFSM